MERTIAWCFVAAACAAGCAGGPADTATPMLTEEQMMQRMQELGTPGAGHRRLDPLVGVFDTASSFWNAPGAPPESGTGVSTNTWELEGRYLKQHYTSEYAGQPFTGIGLTGFNNLLGVYEGTWFDSMSTGILPLSTGTFDAGGKVLTSTRSYVNMMTGKPATTREILTIHDADRHTFEWWQTDEGVPEFLMMKFEYTRRR